MRALVFLLIVVLAGGCKAHVFSPPSGAFLVESPGTLGCGKRSVQVDGFTGGAMFGPHVSSYRVSLARALSDELDVSVAPAVLVIHGAGARDSHPGIYALRAGVKYAPVRHVALVGGLGGGGSAAGGFFSPDVGVIAGYENPHLIPFVALRGLLSVPFADRPVHFTTGDDASEDHHDEDSARDHYRLRPRFTRGVQWSAGLRAPLVPRDVTRAVPSLACALGLTSLYDGRAHGKQTYSGLACALDVRF